MGSIQKTFNKIRKPGTFFLTKIMASLSIACSIFKCSKFVLKVWMITKEWDELYDEWKTGQFQDLHTATMDDTAQNTYRKLNKLSKELKVFYLH